MIVTHLITAPSINISVLSNLSLLFSLINFGRQSTVNGLPVAVVLAFSKTVPECTYLYFDRSFTSIKLLVMSAKIKINVPGVTIETDWVPTTQYI